MPRVGLEEFLRSLRSLRLPPSAGMDHRGKYCPIGDAAPETMCELQCFFHDEVRDVMRYGKVVADTFDIKTHAIVACNQGLIKTVAIETRYRQLHRSIPFKRASPMSQLVRSTRFSSCRSLNRAVSTCSKRCPVGATMTMRSR